MLKIFILAFVFAIIWKSSCGIGLNCNFVNQGWVTIGSIYTCSTSNITIDVGSNESITLVNGTHQSGRTNADVLGLIIDSKGMEYFPVNIAQFFPNVKALSLPNNTISFVNNQHLFPLSKLVCLGLDWNRITSLDSNLFSGLSLQWISLRYNNIKHVGNEFILPNTLPTSGIIHFNNNPCINRQASTPGQITVLRNSLLEGCQPSWLINVTVQTENLVQRTDGIESRHSETDGKVESLTNAVTVLENRNLQLRNEVTELQQINVELTNDVTGLTNDVTGLTNEMTNVQQRNIELTNDVTELTNEMTDLQESNSELTNEVTNVQQRNIELTNDVTELTNEMTDLQESNAELTNEVTNLQQQNLQLETRIGFVDTRARFLEERVAVLESIIENKLRLNH